MTLRAIRPLAGTSRGAWRRARVSRTSLRPRLTPTRAGATPPQEGDIPDFKEEGLPDPSEGALPDPVPPPPSYANVLLAAALSALIYNIKYNHEREVRLRSLKVLVPLALKDPESGLLDPDTKEVVRSLSERDDAGIKFEDFISLDGTWCQWSTCHDTECGIFVSKRLKRIVAAFRGTEPGPREWLLTNVLPSSQGRNDDFFCKDSDPDSRVHWGWLGAYTKCGIGKKIEAEVVKLYNVHSNFGEDRSWGVLITGHSLGGALATLCAYRLTVCAYDIDNIPSQSVPVEMVNFAAPRVGNPAFKRELEMSPALLVRIVNNNDPVPRLPPPESLLGLIPYRHVGPFVKFDEAGTATVYGADQSHRELHPSGFLWGAVDPVKRADHTMGAPDDGKNSYLKKLVTLGAVGWPGQRGTAAPP